MRNLLITLFLFTTALSFSQKTELKDVPKKASKIILTNDLTKKNNLIYVIQSLLENGYTIYQYDKEFGTIKTDTNQIEGINGLYFLNIRVKNNKIIITGKMTINISIDLGSVESHSSFSDILNKGKKGSADRKSFEHMFEFAQKLNFSKIEFEK
jgi:hypothetical protein